MKFIKIAVSASILGLATSANAQTVNFDGVSTDPIEKLGGGAVIEGMKFYQKRASDSVNANRHFVVDGDAYHKGGHSISTSGQYGYLSYLEDDFYYSSIKAATGEEFNFNSANFAKWHPDHTVYSIILTGLNDGVALYEKTINLTELPTLSTFNWKKVDEIRITNNVNYALGSSFGDWAMDDFTYVLVSSIPEPDTIALMFGGLGLVGFMAARRRKLA